jgi:hypothetical protein
MTEIDNINKFPFKVPDGYFEKLQDRLSHIPKESVSSDHGRISATETEESFIGKEMATSFWQKFRPYVALAASFAIAVVIGSYILDKTLGKTKPEGTYENMMYADIVPVTDPYSIYGESSAYAKNELTQDDLENYIIASGTTVEQFENTAYEDNH